MFLCPSAQMLGCWLWSAVCFLFCHSRFKPTNAALLLEENYRVPSTEVKPGGRVSEERSLFPRQMHNLNSALALVSCVPTIYLSLLKGLPQVKDPMCIGERGMDPCSLDKTCVSSMVVVLMLLPAVLKHMPGKEEILQRGTGLLLTPTLVSPARSCRAALQSKITLSCANKLH